MSLTALTLAGCAAVVPVGGKVLDDQQRPLKDVLVQLRPVDREGSPSTDSRKVCRTFTNELGEYSCATVGIESFKRNREYQIEFQRSGYKTAASSIHYPSGALQVQLPPDWSLAPPTVGDPPPRRRLETGPGRIGE